MNTIFIAEQHIEYVTDNSEDGKQERDRFYPQFVRSQTGVGASRSVSH
ncbi:hypothetical protein [Symbiopectobacterium sp.]